MATISNLDVNLFARTKTFDVPLKVSAFAWRNFASTINSGGRAIRGTFGGIAKAASGLPGKIAGVVGAAAGFVSVAAAVSKVNEQFTLLEDLGKTADSLGVSVAEMQSLSVAAKFAGADMKQVEEVMIKVARIAAGDATQKQVAALDDLGLSVEKFSGMTGVQAFTTINDAIAKLGTESEKTAARFVIFGKGFSGLTTDLLGADAIQKASTDIDAFGLALTRVDTANLQVANEAWGKLTMLVDGLWQKIAVQFAPAFTALVEMFVDGTKEAGGFGDAVATGFERFVSGIDLAVRAWDFMVAGWELGKLAIIGGVLYPILEILAKIESGLMGLAKKAEGVTFAGMQIMPDAENFNLGLRAMADEAGKTAYKIGTEVGDRFGKAFGESDVANDFQKRMDEARQQANDIAAESAEAGKKKFAPKKPLIDWKGLFGAAEEQAKGLGEFGLGLAKEIFRGNPKKEKNKAPESRPTVAAVSQYSTAAMSAINQTRDPAANAVNKNHREAQTSRKKQEEALREIGRTLAGGVSGVLVRLGGGA